MPNSRSAKKRMRQSESRNERNRHQRSQLRNAVRKVRAATTPAEASEAFVAAERLLDRAAQKRIVHPNLAGRVKSRLQKHIAALQA